MLDDLKKEQATVCENQKAQQLSDTELDDVSGGISYELISKYSSICKTCQIYKEEERYSTIKELISQFKTGYVCRSCPYLEEFNQVAKDNGASPFTRL